MSADLPSRQEGFADFDHVAGAQGQEHVVLAQAREERSARASSRLPAKRTDCPFAAIASTRRSAVMPVSGGLAGRVDVREPQFVAQARRRP